MADSETETLAQLSKGNHADLEYAAMLVVWPSYIRKGESLAFVQRRVFK